MMYSRLLVGWDLWGKGQLAKTSANSRLYIGAIFNQLASNQYRWKACLYWLELHFSTY